MKRITSRELDMERGGLREIDGDMWMERDGMREVDGERWIERVDDERSMERDE
jgi:hypothetical protein